MSFNSHSLNRLRELSRSLPQRLPEPKMPTRPKASQIRHKVETEEDTENLFRELMQVSSDGKVPKHLMTRLKQLEQRQAFSSRTINLSSEAKPNLPLLNKAPAGRSKAVDPQRSKVTASNELDSLYVAFHQMLLEDEEHPSN
ncbi:hypothetical protein [Synechococcus sp. M16CYN]|uniref:hypothetical protein n=1 Tax=Synechococcus sp. M16CYN TaxID=3103139 RepID=UPI0032527B0D